MMEEAPVLDRDEGLADIRRQRHDIDRIGAHGAAPRDRLAVGGEDEEARRRDRLQRLGERRGEGQPADEEDERAGREAQDIFGALADDQADPLLPAAVAVEQGRDDGGPLGLQILGADRDRPDAFERAVEIVGADRLLDIVPRRRAVAMGRAHVGRELRHGDVSHLARLVQRLLEPGAVLFGEGAPGFG